MNRFWYGIGATLVAAVGGSAIYVGSCSDDTCSVEARASVEVALVDSDGRPLTARSVWYQADPSDEQELVDHATRAECVDEACTMWVAGRELPGGFEISASVCGEVQTQRVEVAMDESQCHVNTERVEFAYDCEVPPHLPPGPDKTLADHVPPKPSPACSDEVLPSVRLSVVDAATGMMRPASAAGFSLVPFVEQDLDVEPAPTAARSNPRPATGLGACASDLCDVWELGVEQTGRFTVWVEACDRRSDPVELEVKSGPCHVQTQDVVVRMDCSTSPTVNPIDDEPARTLAAGGEPPRPQPACTTELRPSVVVRTFDLQTGSPMPASAAGFSRMPFAETQVGAQNGGSMGPRPTVGTGKCAGGICDAWSLAEELDGRFEVWAEACGERSENVSVEVPMMENGCHVETQQVRIGLDCTGCNPPHDHTKVAAQ